MAKYVIKRVSDELYLASDERDGEFYNFQFSKELFCAKRFSKIEVASMRLCDLENEGHHCVIMDYEDAVYGVVLDFINRLEKGGWQPCN